MSIFFLFFLKKLISRGGSLVFSSLINYFLWTYFIIYSYFSKVIGYISINRSKNRIKILSFWNEICLSYKISLAKKKYIDKLSRFLQRFHPYSLRYGNNVFE